MLEYRQDESAGIVEVTVDGMVTQQDLEEVAKNLEGLVARHGKLKLLKEVRGLPDIDVATFWENAKLGFRHFNDFSHYAIVTDKTWVEPLAKAGAALMSCEVRVFPLEEIEAARKWLREA